MIQPSPLVLYLLIILSFLSYSCNGYVNVSIPWETFLAKHDPQWSWEKESNGTWRNLPWSWEQGGFIGNGLLGSLIIVDNQTLGLKWRVARTDVWDHRQKGQPYSLNDFSYDKPRLPVGSFHVSTLGTPIAGTMYLSIYNATLFGFFATTQGNISWTSFAHATLPVLVVDISILGNEQVTFNFEPAPAVSPRNFSRPNPLYVPNPPSNSFQVSGMNISQQPLLAGGGHVTAWQQVVSSSKSTLFLSIGFDKQSLTSAQNFAETSVANGIKMGIPALLETHTEWWHQFFQKSFVSIPDTKMEGFYYLQMYKVASGTRGNTPALDLLGPWMPTETPWPDLHWDLNVQVTYWPLYASNHLDIAESLPLLILNNLDNLQKNVNSSFANSIGIPMASSNDLLTSCYDNHTASCLVGPQEETGNMMWVCHNLWLHYRYSMDLDYLRDVFYPILKQAVNFYINLAYFNNQDASYHLPVSWSPEYPARGPDANYDIALFRWGLQTLLDIALNILNIRDPIDISTWEKYNATLVDYQVDNSTGFMVARDIVFTESHHLYSHLFMMYPLHIINYEQTQYAELMEKSLDHWFSLNSTFRGHSWTGAASMSALLGRNEAALGNLTFFLNGGCISTGKCGLGPNTLYYEEGEQWGCIETPGSLTSTLHELFLQSWDNGIVHVFPAMSVEWPSASFYNLLSEGGFLVTAKWQNSSTEFIQITSNAEFPCVIKTNIPTPITVDPLYPFVVTPAAEIGWTLVTLKITKGQTATLHQLGSGPNFSLDPLPGNPAYFHFWGYH